MPRQVKNSIRASYRTLIVLFIVVFAGIGVKFTLQSRAAATCTTTVSSAAAAQSAVSSANDGDTICVSAGSYNSALTLTRSGSHAANVTVMPDPSQDPNGAGKVTFTGININDNYITVHNFYSTGGITINSGGSNDIIDHNDVSQAGCGFGIAVYGTFSGSTFTSVATNDTISGNRIHDTGDSSSGCEADSLRIQGYKNLTITGNELFNIKECPTNNCHTDTLQSYQANVQTSGLDIEKNYIHDTTDAQGFPFLKDGDIQDVTIKDNLSLRMASVGETTGPGIDENSSALNNAYGVIMENNTYLVGGYLQPGGSAANPTATMDHNVLDSYNTQGGNYGTFIHKYNDYLNKFQVEFTYGLDSTEMQNANLTYKCGSSCNSTAATPFACNAACSNLNRAGDDYELATNPNGIGIDWSPANQTYGPVNTSGSSGGVTGDLNSDGHVNIFDLSIFLSHWQQSGTGLAEDFNNDGVANIFDLSILLSHYGS
jgi:hypothetical protein